MLHAETHHRGTTKNGKTCDTKEEYSTSRGEIIHKKEGDFTVFWTQRNMLTFASLEKRRNASGSMPRVKKTLVSPQKSKSSDPKYAAGSTNTTAARNARSSSTDPRTQNREGQVIIHPRALLISVEGEKMEEVRKTKRVYLHQKQ